MNFFSSKLTFITGYIQITGFKCKLQLFLWFKASVRKIPMQEDLSLVSAFCRSQNINFQIESLFQVRRLNATVATCRFFPVRMSPFYFIQ